MIPLQRRRSRVLQPKLPQQPPHDGIKIAIAEAKATHWSATDLPKKIPSLDGLRAVSIALVLFSHLLGTRGFPIALSTLLGAAGSFGVRIFFVISGLLITTLLLREHTHRGSISLRDFYARRFCRIFPAFYTYLAFVGIMVATGYSNTLRGDFPHALTYTMNYHAPHGWIMGHLWSLSVEEQFYLLWPALLAFAGPSRALRFAAGAIAVVPLLRFGSLQFFRTQSEFFGMQFHLCCDALAVGCVLAIGHRWLGERPWYLRLLHSRAFVLIPVSAVLLNGLTEHPRILALAGYTIMNVAIALTIDRLVRFPLGLVGRLLNSTPLRFIGTLSYSLYLWQQFFLDRNSTHFLNAFPLNLGMAVLAALGSYYLIESPFLRLKERFAR